MSVMISANQNWTLQISLSCHPVRLKLGASRSIDTQFGRFVFGMQQTDTKLIIPHQ